MNIKQYKTETLDCLSMLGESKNQYFKNNEIIKKRTFNSSKNKKNILKILGLTESDLKKKRK